MSCRFHQNKALRAAQHGAARAMADARRPGMSCRFHQNKALRAAQHGSARAMTDARRPGMSCRFHQNRHCAQRSMARLAPWLMHGGRS